MLWIQLKKSKSISITIDMTNNHKTLSDQVKEAEIAKLIVEKEKIEYDLAQSKIPPKVNYKEWVIMFATLSSLLFLYIEYGFKPTLQVETRRAELDNLVTGKKLFKLEGHLDTVSKFLNVESIELEKRKKMIDSLSIVNSVQKSTNIDLTQQKNILTSDKHKIETQIITLKNSVENLKSEKEQLQPFVDSLQGLANFEARARYNNTVNVLVIFQITPGDYHSLSLNVPIISYYGNDNQKLISTSWHTNGVGQVNYNLFPGDDCEITLKGRFRLKDGKSTFHFKVPENGGEITVPVFDTKNEFK
jgi:hypothetical protein